MATATSEQPTASSAPWHAAFPAPRNKSPKVISRSTVLDSIRSGGHAGKDFVLIDVRRNDHEGGTVRGSLNLPAQSFWWMRETLMEVCTRAGVKKVIFYCGSSAGRGTRTAGWFDDMLVDHGVTGTESLILEGGIKGWANAGEEYTAWMDGYVREHWEKFKE